MLDVKKFIFVEGLPPYTHYRFMTDLTNTFTMVKKDNFLDALRSTYHFKRVDVDDIEVKISSGMVLMLDIEGKVAYRYDGLEKVVTGETIIRGGDSNKKISIFDQKVVDFVNEKLRN